MSLSKKLFVGMVLVTVFSTANSSPLLIEIPEEVKHGECRPVNISKSEMQRQWQLYSNHASGLSISESLTNSEMRAQQRQGLQIESGQCYVDSKVFSAMCLTVSKRGNYSLRTIKLMHRPDGADCFYIVNIE